MHRDTALLQRQPQAHPQAAIGGVAQGNVAAVAADGVAGEGQSQADPAGAGLREPSSR